MLAPGPDLSSGPDLGVGKIVDEEGFSLCPGAALCVPDLLSVLERVSAQ